MKIEFRLTNPRFFASIIVRIAFAWLVLTLWGRGTFLESRAALETTYHLEEKDDVSRLRPGA